MVATDRADSPVREALEADHPALRMFALFNRLDEALAADTVPGALDAALDALAEVYADTVHFIDPAHEIHGLPALRNYFGALYGGARSCRFELEHAVLGEAESTLYWHMTLRHRSLNGGRPVRVPGVSHLRHRERVHAHRDYFDLGALVYEHLPLLGRVVRAVKHRLGA